MNLFMVLRNPSHQEPARLLSQGRWWLNPTGGMLDDDVSLRQGQGTTALLPRSRTKGRSHHRTFTWISQFLAHVPRLDTEIGGQPARDCSGLSRLRLQ